MMYNRALWGGVHYRTTKREGFQDVKTGYNSWTTPKCDIPHPCTATFFPSTVPQRVCNFICSKVGDEDALGSVVLHLVIASNKALFTFVLVWLFRLESGLLQSLGGRVVDAYATSAAARTRGQDGRGVDLLKIVFLSVEGDGQESYFRHFGRVGRVESGARGSDRGEKRTDLHFIVLVLFFLFFFLIIVLIIHHVLGGNLLSLAFTLVLG